MGLAASQARFLNLTARKTNIEYEGQQINQQRTTLSNQSASYYNQMLTLSVPTPPSTDTYKTISYSFANGKGDGTSTISQVTKKDDGTYTVVYTYANTEQQIVNASSNSKITKNAEGKYFYNNSYELKLVSENPELATSAAAVGAGIKSAGNLASAPAANQIYYAQMGSGAAVSYVYFTKAEVEAISSEGTANQYKMASVTSYETESEVASSVTRDANNRIASLIIDGQEYSVSTNTSTDNDAYDNAYNEYTYKTYLYQQEMENINAQTSVIQAEDKKLELRLKQLDTEQSAISTEMESVKSVIKKNSEDSFKTFA